jgi:hypothetical protein
MAFLAAMAPALSLVSGAVSAIGAISAGNAQAAAANYNAQVQEQQARVAMDQASAQAAQEARKTRQIVAAAEAGAADSGLTLTGTTGAVINQARDTGNMNVLLAMYDGSLKATGYRNNANLERANARASRVASYFGAGTSLLGGAADFYKTSQLAV